MQKYMCQDIEVVEEALYEWELRGEVVLQTPETIKDNVWWLTKTDEDLMLVIYNESQGFNIFDSNPNGVTAFDVTLTQEELKKYMAAKEALWQDNHSQ